MQKVIVLARKSALQTRFQIVQTKRSAKPSKKSVSLTQKSIGLKPKSARGLMFALANGKLCFERLKTLSAAQNYLPRKRGGKRSEVTFSVAKSSILQMLIKSHSSINSQNQ